MVSPLLLSLVSDGFDIVVEGGAAKTLYTNFTQTLIHHSSHDIFLTCMSCLFNRTQQYQEAL